MYLLAGLVENATDDLDDLVDAREGGQLEVARVGHRDVGLGDAMDGRVEVIKGLRLHDLRTDLGTDAEHREAALYCHNVVRLLDAIKAETEGGEPRAETKLIGKKTDKKKDT